MKFIGKKELAAVPDLRHRLQQLRWFRRTFLKNASAITNQYGIHFTIDNFLLDRAFIDWAKALSSYKHFVHINRADFIVFASGLVLKELIHKDPSQIAPTPPDEMIPPDMVSEIVTFWPEGFLYTNYCITAITALFEQEFAREPVLSTSIDDLRTWWSFKENSREFPAYAVAYLDKFLGNDPNWTLPDLPEVRQAMKHPEASCKVLQHSRLLNA